jgi:hypothetical protein
MRAHTRAEMRGGRDNGRVQARRGAPRLRRIELGVFVNLPLELLDALRLPLLLERELL